MAESTLLQITPDGNAPDSLITETLAGQPAILSTQIADKFKKKHKNILRDIEQIKAQVPEIFYRLNFEPSFREAESGNGTIRKFPVYLLTRDAFCLLVMGFTGKAAMQWKIRYIEAFNALEQAALARGVELAREAGYMQGREEALSLPQIQVIQKEAYLNGLREGQKYRAARDGLQMLKKISHYRRLGLTCREIGKILGISKSSVAAKIKVGRNLACGLAQNGQQSLPGVM